jgi:NAD(P)-dependent dehydrogenase (short-subunit alcohol dehydrogenase family)
MGARPVASDRPLHPDVAGLFDLTGQVAIVTGGCGLLGFRHAQAIAAAGGIPVLVDLGSTDPPAKARELEERYGIRALGYRADVTSPADLQQLLVSVIAEVGTVDILINNAANNPKVESSAGSGWSRLENFSLAMWEADMAVGLTGAFLCSQVIGAEMARRNKGVIINVASDLAVIAPDQRLYRQDGLPPDEQPVKPVTYSVVKTGLLGLTRYLATYWADRGVRVNAISPGGVYDGQPEVFVSRLQQLIPLSRMARVDEYQGAILFLCSDASSYMTGTNLVIDGGRSVW